MRMIVLSMKSGPSRVNAQATATGPFRRLKVNVIAYNVFVGRENIGC